MNEVAKWAWVSLLAILSMGQWFLVLIGVELVILALIAWLKPEWLHRD